MIISPRAAHVTNVLRKEGSGFVRVDDVALYRRGGGEKPYEKIPYWKRSEDSNDPPPKKLSSFVVVPQVAAAAEKGFAVYGNFTNNPEAVHAWKAFDRSAETSGSFGTPSTQASGDNKYAWAIVSFPKARLIRSVALQFEYCYSSFFLAAYGTSDSQHWTRLLESPKITPINNGWFGNFLMPKECTALKILTDWNSPVRSCQFFEAEPLVPVTLSSNTDSNVKLISEPVNYNLYRCFTEQSNAFSHGTAQWYWNGSEKRSNRGRVSTPDQNRFSVEFLEPKIICGLSVGGISNFYSGYSYANCLLIEGRESSQDFWKILGEIEFEPSQRNTNYFDFAVSRTVKEVRITIQDITIPPNTSQSSSVYLLPMQFYGEGENRGER